jgi:hypothetical protein
MYFVTEILEIHIPAKYLVEKLKRILLSENITMDRKIN